MKKIAVLLLIGLAARLYFAYYYPGTFDQSAYENTVRIVQRGGNIYAETRHYNYSPFWFLWLVALSRLPVPFHFAVRGFLSLIDIVNALLLYRIANRIKPSMGLIAFASYMLCPAAILIVGYHGQFETLALLPLFLALERLERKPAPNLWIIWALGTLSLVIKHITLFGVLTLFVYAAPTKRRAVLMTLAAGLIFLATFLPFVPDGREGIIRNVFGYSGLVGFFGLTRLLPLNVVKLLFFTIMPVLPFFARYKLRLPAIEGLSLSFVGFLTLAPGFFFQYILPILLLGWFIGRKWYLTLVITATVAAVREYFISDLLPVGLLENLIWLLCIFRLFWYLRFSWMTVFQKATATQTL